MAHFPNGVKETYSEVTLESKDQLQLVISHVTVFWTTVYSIDMLVLGWAFLPGSLGHWAQGDNVDYYQILVLCGQSV